MRVWTALANAQLHSINGMKLKDIQGTIRTSAMLSARFAMDTRCTDTTEVNMCEVDYVTYCPKCKNFKVLETDEPCNQCLTECAREGSKKPVKFEEKTRK